MTNALIRRMVGVVAAALALQATDVIAQEKNQQKEGELTEVIVTAYKRSENLQNVSASITAISGADLAAAGINNIDRLELLTPGLLLGRAGVDSIPAIRGARTAQVEHNDTMISFYTDGIAQPRHGQALAGFFDVERVEVLRGPQGTLFGRNTLGGAVSVITKAPGYEQLDYGASVSLGNYNARNLQAFVNVPVGERFALRLSGNRETQDPIVKNTTIGDRGGFKDADNYFVRAQLAFRPSDALSARFKYEVWKDDSNGPGDYGYRVLGIPINPATGRTNPFIPNAVLLPSIGRNAACTAGCGRFSAGGLSPATSARAQSLAAFGPYVTQGEFEPSLNIDQDAAFGEIQYEGWDFADLKTTLSYTDYKELRYTDGDLSPLPGLSEGVLTNSRTTSEEIQLVSKGESALQWVLGAYFFQEDMQQSFLQRQLYAVDANNTPILSQPQNFWVDSTKLINIATRSSAAFGHVKYSVTDKLRLLGGLRYTEDKRTWFILDQPANLTTLTFANLDTPKTGKTWSQTTWKAGIEYDVDPDIMAYATASTGYLAGNAQGQFNGTATYDEQTGTAYEVGLKSTLAEGRVRLNLAAYYNQYRDLLSIRFIDTATTTLASTSNAGAINSKGLEVEADWQPSEPFNLGARISFMHARFGDFQLTRRYQEGGNIRPNAAGQFTAWQLDGIQVPNSPDFTATLFGSYKFELGDRGTITPLVSIYFNDGYRTADDPLLFSDQKSFHKTDVSVAWASASSKLAVRVWVRNLEDEATINRGTRFGGDLAVVDYALPRMYGITMNYNF